LAIPQGATDPEPEGLEDRTRNSVLTPILPPMPRIAARAIALPPPASSRDSVVRKRGLNPCKRRDCKELAGWTLMHPRPHCFLVQGRLSEVSLEDQEQGDSSDCENLTKLHDPLGHTASRDARGTNVSFDLAPLVVESQLLSDNKSLKPPGTCSFLAPATGIASPCTDANPLAWRGRAR
jgi:hypothetical protein